MISKRDCIIIFINSISKKKKYGEKYEYEIEACQNIYDAIYKLEKGDIQLVLMSKKALETIEDDSGLKLPKSEEPKLLSSVQQEIGKEIGDDAFAMVDEELHCQIRDAVPMKLDGSTQACSYKFKLVSQSDSRSIFRSLPRNCEGAAFEACRAQTLRPSPFDLAP